MHLWPTIWTTDTVCAFQMRLNWGPSWAFPTGAAVVANIGIPLLGSGSADLGVHAPSSLSTTTCVCFDVCQHALAGMVPTQELQWQLE